MLGFVLATLVLSREDLYFQAAQEQWACAVSTRKTVPVEVRDWFTRLGADSWRVRDEASKAILRDCRERPELARWIHWGTQSEDCEVRLRCNILLRKLYTCTTCNGKGQIEIMHDWFNDCKECYGTGSLWLERLW